jgi:hypothetical protein
LKKVQNKKSLETEKNAPDLQKQEKLNHPSRKRKKRKTWPPGLRTFPKPE